MKHNVYKLNHRPKGHNRLRRQGGVMEYTIAKLQESRSKLSEELEEVERVLVDTEAINTPQFYSLQQLRDSILNHKNAVVQCIYAIRHQVIHPSVEGV